MKRCLIKPLEGKEFLSSQIYFIKTYKKFIDLIYKKHKYFSEIKGYIVVACDGSIFDLPNVTLTRREFNIEDHNEFGKHRIKARVSGMLDVNSKFMLTTKYC